MYHESVSETGRLTQHIHRELECVWQHHTFDTGMRDVAFVPQGHVFQPGLQVSPKDATESAQPLRENRIALVRHRRRTLLARGEGLFGFSDFTTGQMAHFKAELFYRSTNRRARVEHLGVAVAGADRSAERR